MTSHQYNVILEKELVDECRKYLSDAGSKLSPVINNLLEIWLSNQKKIRKEFKEEAKVNG